MFEVGRLIARISLEGATTFGKDLNKVGKEFANLDDTGKKAATNVGASLAVVGGAILGVAAVAVKKFAEFDAAMSQVNAVTQTTASNQKKLRDAAIEAGAATKYSATEAADAEVSLAKAGVQTADIIGGGLAGALSLASAGEIAVADAADTAATAMTQFKLSGSEIPHLADLLAAGAGKAQGGVGDLSMALKQAGLVAAQFGLSADDTIGTLSAFASAGLIGSDAGTSFRTMLLSLANPSTQAQKALDQYNISAYDAQGNFVGITKLAENLKTGLSNATDAQRNQALATIFGTDAIRAANVLYNQGAKGIQDWTNKVNDAGYASRQAAALQNNLAGDVEKLGGSFDTAFITTGAAANDVMRSMVQALTNLINAYAALDPQVQATVLYIGIATGAVLLFGGSMLVAVPKIVEFRAALATLNKEMPVFSKGVGAAGLALKALPVVAVIAWLANLTSGFIDSAREAAGLDETVTSLSKKLKKGVDTGAVDKQISQTVAGWNDGFNQLSQLTNTGWAAPITKGAYDVLDGLNQWNPVFKAIGAGSTDLTKRVGTLDSSLANLVKGGNADEAAKTFAYLKTKTDGSKEALANLTKLFPEYAASLSEVKDKTDANASSTVQSAQAYQDAAKNASDLNQQISDLIDTINAANGVGQDAVSKNAAYQQSLSDVEATIQKVKEGADGYSSSIDQTTAAGSKNADMFAQLAQKSQDAAKAQFDVDNNTQNYQKNLEGGRQTLIDQITALTGNADAAKALADQIYKIPSYKEIQILADTANAADKIAGFIHRYDGTRVRFYVDAYGGTSYQIPNSSVRFNKEGSITHYAGGGTHEKHVAQIANAGDMRVWAEPETGGELYAPLAPAKRQRSMSLITQQLSEWGYDVVARGATQNRPESRDTGSAASPAGMRITGTLDLGDGLTGMIDGRIVSAFGHDAQQAQRGYRKP